VTLLTQLIHKHLHILITRIINPIKIHKSQNPQKEKKKKAKKTAFFFVTAYFIEMDIRKKLKSNIV
jgi:hypothetical protein